MKRIAVLLCVFFVLCTIVPSAQGQQTAVRFVHAVYNAPPVTVNFGQLPFFLKRSPLSASSVRSELPALSYQIEVRDTQSVNPPVLHSATVDITGNIQQSLVLVGQPSNLSLLTLAWDKTLPQIGNVKMRYVHAALSVESTLSGFVGGSLFFSSIPQFTGTTFIEIPLAQASSVAFFTAMSGAKVAKVDGKQSFEAGNVYTVYLVDGNDGPEVRIVNETSIDEQVPMPVLPHSGIRHSMRVVHMVSSAAALTWEINNAPVFPNIAPASASKEATVFIEYPLNVVIYPQNQPANIVFDDSFLPSTTQSMTLVSYKAQNAVQLRPLFWDAKPAAAGRARVRVFNAVTGLDNTALTIGGAQVFSGVGFGTATEFKDVEAGATTLALVNAQPQLPVTEVRFEPTATRVYTLFLSGTAPNVEVRLLEESAAAAQLPLPLLAPIEQSTAQLRTANLIHSDKFMRVHSAGAVVTPRIAYASAGAIVEGIPLGDRTFAVSDADLADAPVLASAQGAIANGRKYLLVYAGTEQEAWGAVYPSPTPKQVNDSVQIRFLHAINGEKDISIIGEKTEIKLAKNLEYRAMSQYVAVPQEGITYNILGSNGKPLGTIRDDGNHQSSLTVFLVYENDKLVAYVLPDNGEGTVEPMQKLEVTVGVREPWADFSRNVSTAYPNPSNGTVTVTVQLPVSCSLAFWVTDVTGTVVQERVTSHYGAGVHTLRTVDSPLASGIYYLHIQTDGQYTVKPFVVLQ